MGLGAIVGDVTIGLGVANATVQIADVLISKPSKMRLAEFLDRTYITLDDVARTDHLRRVVRSRRQWIASAVVGGLVGLVGLYTMWSLALAEVYGLLTSRQTLVIRLLVGLSFLGWCVAAVRYLPRLGQWVAAGEGYWRINRRGALAVSVLMGPPLLVIIGLGGLAEAEWLDYLMLRWRLSLMLVVSETTFLFGAAAATCFVPFALVDGFSDVVRLTRLVVLRLAEHPRGPALGASALLVGLGAILKAVAGV